MTRSPAVAGQFYPGSQSALRREIKKYIDYQVEKVDVKGAMLPHAGYIYSGMVAGATISRIGPKESFVILGPNHTGLGKPYAIMTEGKWNTPLGDIEIDSILAKTILRQSDYLQDDFQAHLAEHSIEVQLPFLQYLYPQAKIVPITVAAEDRGEILKKIGLEIASAISGLNKNVAVFASSDLTHYESSDSAEKKDRQAIEAILRLDEDQLLDRVARLKISMCGYAPTAIMLSACKKMGAKDAEVVQYQTSGDVNGDYTRVVGYAGILIK